MKCVWMMKKNGGHVRFVAQLKSNLTHALCELDVKNVEQQVD